ncbi:uncharacterized protein LOC133356600 [Lethenteron reissneri]|uniref:uncharacterized protein LOC133356600 n=1 Tax=Lethenteron reissneri TaxID=7753 RepID=UPI002AB6ED20|nr:uncharacterized protein LOC133356600 [Lethenteron reissneri]XP_061430202.1 uncharacterized protein LOC133356600 [Lethenteron reissneri]XP_061430203.1 uncharacterized protein LOC133356600 [Lethenteron reissneri]XP_061430206.1 uncharacterized protein LOC133356600 [Lethenteron reissneri]
MFTHVKKPTLSNKGAGSEDIFPIDYYEDLQNAASIVDIFKSSANGSRPASVILTSAPWTAGVEAPLTPPTSPVPSPPSASAEEAPMRGCLGPCRRRRCRCTGRLCALLVLLSCLVLATAALSAATFYLTELHAVEVASLRQQIEAQGVVLQRLRSLAARNAGSKAALVSPASGIRSASETGRSKGHASLGKAQPTRPLTAAR